MESSHNSAHQDIEHKLEHAESKISQLQAELTHTQSIYQSMIEHIPACVAIFKAVEGGTDFVFTEFNKAAEGFEKISKSALLGKKVTEVFKGVEEFGILKVFQGVWKSGEPAIYPSKIYSIEKFEGYRENYIFKLPSDEIVAIYQDKTKEPQILNGVEKSSKLLKKFPEENPNPVLQFDVNGNLLYSNKASAELLKAWGLHDNRIQSAKIQNLICSGEPTQEILSIDQDGSKKFFSVTFSPLKNSEFVNIYAYDITDRELAIEKRILSEQRFTKLFKHMLDGSALHKIVLDATGHPIDYVYVDINPAFTKMVGLTREMAIGKKVSEVIPGVLEDSTNLIQKFGNVALNNETISYEINFEPLQKSFAVTAYCPEKEYFVTVFRDITLKQKLEKEQENLIYTLNKRMKELQCLFKFSEISEHNNNIEESLAAFLVEIPKAWQYPSSTYAKIVFREQSYTTPNYQSTPWMQKEDIIIYGKKLGQIEVGYLEKKSDEDEGPFFTEERDLVKMLAERISRFIERRQTEAEIKAVNKELEAFSYSVSHDLRAPLRSIDGFSLVILEDYSTYLDETGKDYLNRIRAGVQRMGNLINEILELSRLSRVDLHQTVVDLSDVARMIFNELKLANPDRQIDSNIQENVTCRCDPNLIKIVFQNLLENAWKFSRKKSSVKIDFRVLRKENQTVYCVQDNGAGFDMAYYDKLFGPFQRLHSSYEFEGVGIGLCTVQRIIHRHNGEIWAKGKVGEGATFYFTLE